MKILPGPTASRIEGRTSIVAGLKYSRHPLPNITKKNKIIFLILQTCNVQSCVRDENTSFWQY